MDVHFWDKRYKEQGYAYGLEANDFLKSKINELKPQSKILCLAEGEGRNAIFLAEHNHEVTAIDYSIEGLNKLINLAEDRNLNIETICADLSNYKIESNKWDAIICVFGHFPASIRQSIFTQVYGGLKSNGVFLMEAYDKNQLKFKTGGPQVEELLYNTEELESDFHKFNNIFIKTHIREISEGIYHNGNSSVIQVIAIKD
jgi:SAM-dependent methyltransferase